MGILTKISVYECLLLLGIYSFGLFIFMSGLLPNDPATKVDKSKISFISDQYFGFI